jgi:uncharacterized protein YndB with AHSA1/START domain
VTTVVVQRRLAVPPARAWAAFVDEVDAWWGRDARYRTQPEARVRFEADAFVEVGEPRRVIAAVVCREPPARLELRVDGDPVVVRFDPDPLGTRVVVEATRRAHLTAFQSPRGVFWADALSRLGRVATR